VGDALLDSNTVQNNENEEEPKDDIPKPKKLPVGQCIGLFIVHILIVVVVVALVLTIAVPWDKPWIAEHYEFEIVKVQLPWLSDLTNQSRVISQRGGQVTLINANVSMWTFGDTILCNEGTYPKCLNKSLKLSTRLLSSVMFVEKHPNSTVAFYSSHRATNVLQDPASVIPSPNIDPDLSVISPSGGVHAWGMSFLYWEVLELDPKRLNDSHHYAYGAGILSNTSYAEASFTRIYADNTTFDMPQPSVSVYYDNAVYQFVKRKNADGSHDIIIAKCDSDSIITPYPTYLFWNGDNETPVYQPRLITNTPAVVQSVSGDFDVKYIPFLKKFVFLTSHGSQINIYAADKPWGDYDKPATVEFDVSSISDMAIHPELSYQDGDDFYLYISYCYESKEMWEMPKIAHIKLSKR